MRAIKCFNIYESWLFQNKGLTQNAVHNKLWEFNGKIIQTRWEETRK
jgi:hypothetical protein